MAVKIFFCYAREDEQLLNKLKAHLKPLQRRNIIEIWHDRDIRAGTDWEQEIHQHLNTAQLILLLVSPDFMNSDYCYSVEMKHALERHERKEVCVIPVILRHVYWQEEFGKLQALPTDAIPIIDRYWHSLDEAFFNVVGGIQKAIEDMATTSLLAENTSLPNAEVSGRTEVALPSIPTEKASLEYVKDDEGANEQNQIQDDEYEGPPLVTPDADPGLSDFVETIERDFLLEMLDDIINDQMTEEDAQKSAQEFLALLPFSDKRDLSDKLGILGEKYTAALRVHEKHFPNLGASSAAQGES